MSLGDIYQELNVSPPSGTALPLTNQFHKLSGTIYKYVVPLKRPFTTSRHTNTQSTNYLIQLKMGSHIGIGEAAARGRKLTGDNRKNLGSVAKAMLERIEQCSLDLTSKEAALASIEKTYQQLEEVARLNTDQKKSRKAYRGLLSGFDIALLDLTAKALGMTVAELLGEQRDTAYASASTCSTTRTGQDLITRLQRQALRFNAYRCKGAASFDENMQRLDAMRRANQALSKNKAFWLDLNEAMTPEQAFRFIDEVIEWLESNVAKGQQLILEQPVKKKFYKTLCKLQAYANAKLNPDLAKIIIMADESLWDQADYDLLVASGGVGAVNIKIPKVGGLRPALELANKVHRTDPETLIYIGGMIGTSDIMGRAIYQLVKALPRIDHCTTSPAKNVAANLARNPIRFKNKLSNEIVLGNEPGLGTDINEKALEKYCAEVFQAQSKVTNKLNEYYTPELDEHDQKELDSCLLEQEALLYGLNVSRLDPTRIRISDEAGNKAEFFWTVSKGLSTETRRACRRKYESKVLFKQAGVPVAEGQVFKENQIAEALAYAKQLGWPVVVKPGVGTGGVGVTANIKDEKDVQWAIDHIVNGRKAKERNNGHIIVEKHIDGEELRVFVADDEAVGAVKRVQAHVIGDGESSIRKLIKKKNTTRKTNPRLKNSLLKLSKPTLHEIERQGYSLDSIPPKDEVVTLSLVKSISQGADTVSVLHDVHPSILSAAVRAVNAIPGLRRGGLDFIMTDYTRPLDEQISCICEVNSSPSIAASIFPLKGIPVKVAEKFLLSVAKEKNLKLHTKGSSNELAIQVSLTSSLTNQQLTLLKAYFEHHCLQGGAVSGPSGLEIYAAGRSGSICALPSNLSLILNAQDKPTQVESRLIAIEPSWKETVLKSRKPLFSFDGPYNLGTRKKVVKKRSLLKQIKQLGSKILRKFIRN